MNKIFTKILTWIKDSRATIWNLLKRAPGPPAPGRQPTTPPVPTSTATAPAPGKKQSRKYYWGWVVGVILLLGVIGTLMLMLLSSSARKTLLLQLLGAVGVIAGVIASLLVFQKKKKWYYGVVSLVIIVIIETVLFFVVPLIPAQVETLASKMTLTHISISLAVAASIGLIIFAWRKKERWLKGFGTVLLFLLSYSAMLVAMYAIKREWFTAWYGTGLLFYWTPALLLGAILLIQHGKWLGNISAGLILLMLLSAYLDQRDTLATTRIAVLAPPKKWSEKVAIPSGSAFEITALGPAGTTIYIVTEQDLTYVQKSPDKAALTNEPGTLRFMSGETNAVRVEVAIRKPQAPPRSTETEITASEYARMLLLERRARERTLTITAPSGAWSEIIPIPLGYRFDTQTLGKDGTRVYIMQNESSNTVFLDITPHETGVPGKTESIRFMSGETNSVTVKIVLSPI